MLTFDSSLKFSGSAAASDGGSVAMIFCDRHDSEFWFVLDRGIETDTYNRVFYGGKLLSFKEEKQLLLLLQNIENQDFDYQADREIIKEFILIIQNRSHKT